MSAFAPREGHNSNGHAPLTAAELAGGSFFSSNHALSSGQPSSSAAASSAYQSFLFSSGATLDAANHSSDGGGGGGGRVTLLSDEDEDDALSLAGASDAGSTLTSASVSRAKGRKSSSATPAKGKGKAVDGAAAGGGAVAAGQKKKKPAQTKKQVIGLDGKPVVKEKKKKAGRACAACQKAHLTCDDGRPCARCVKKGCAEDCHDGARKKAKYLQEVPDELLERGRHPPPAGSAPPVDGVLSFSNGASPSLLDHSQPQAGPSQSPSTTLALATQPQPAFDFSASDPTPASGPSTSAAPSTTTPYYDPSSFLNFSAATPNAVEQTQFGSEAANLEYAILSSMLNGNGFALDAHTPNLSGGIGGGGGGGATPGGATGAGSFDPRFAQNGAGEEMLLGGGGGGGGAGGEQSNGGGAGGSGGFGFGGAAEGGAGAGADPFSSPAANGTQPLDFGSGGGAGPSESTAATTGGGSGVPGLMTAEEAYRGVTKPYPYAQSYHYLVKHLKERFDKNDILRIIRALATFRPSLIALQMPLTEEDETFVERTFQRTLVELNKLISFSGTPTVVWRRTGEICLVGTEFCLLTGWKREELVGTGSGTAGLEATTHGGRRGGGKYIFELFDTASVVEYYESFAKHAFESTSTSVTLQCVVLGPDGRPVPCAFCFSVRRDLFSCPFLVIGSFLPILV
ncbi:hypothetical protein JCM1840_006149 [Sporobolomyces johnsonii]